MTWLEDPPPWFRPAYCFAAVIVWTEKNVTIRFVLFWQWNNQRRWRPVLRATTFKKEIKVVNFFEEKSESGDLAWGFFDLAFAPEDLPHDREMTWLPWRLGATAVRVPYKFAFTLHYLLQAGEENEEEEETAGVGGDEEPGLKMMPKWKATRITEMMPDESIAELIDAVLRREAEEMAAVIVAAAQKAAQEQLEEEERAAEEACALAAALAAEEEEEEEEEEDEDEDEEGGSFVAGNSILQLKPYQFQFCFQF